jgi:hypothetical protein
MIRNFSDLSRLKSFDERYNYLKLSGNVGQETFGYNRYLNQVLYVSKRWRGVRDLVIIRDNACDLGLPGYEIGGLVIVHHMNPLTPEEIEDDTNSIYDLSFLISVSFQTHQAIHYGDENKLVRSPEKRFKGDTKLW